MSVYRYDKAEIVALYATSVPLCITTAPRSPSLDLMAESLFAAYLTNRAAVAAAYPETVHELGACENLLPLFDAVPGVVVDPDVARAWVRAVRGLIVSCKDNAGADFLPARHRLRLEYAAQLVTEKLAGM